MSKTNANNVLSETTGGIMSGSSYTAGYDDADRLTTWARPGSAGVPTSSESWSLSLVGDWNSYTKNGVTDTRTHTPAHDYAHGAEGLSHGGANSASRAVTSHGARNERSECQIATTTGNRYYQWDIDNHLASATVGTLSTDYDNDHREMGQSRVSAKHGLDVNRHGARNERSECQYDALGRRERHNLACNLNLNAEGS